MGSKRRKPTEAEQTLHEILVELREVGHLPEGDPAAVVQELIRDNRALRSHMNDLEAEVARLHEARKD